MTLLMLLPYVIYPLSGIVVLLMAVFLWNMIKMEL